MSALKTLVLFSIFALLPAFAQGAWFEASGQAIIERGDKQLARQRATQEAIKQALLFAGASVKSVQQMANGLLQEEKMEIRASGEVNQLELIDEVYTDDYVTVSIRADIFPQHNQCNASDYSKTLVTTWFPIKNPMQAATGAIYQIGEEVALRMQHQLNQFAHHAKIRQVASFAHDWQLQADTSEAMLLAQQANSQFVLTGYITDISMQFSDAGRFQFWKDNTPKRHFAMTLSLLDGVTGAQLLTQNFSSEANWLFNTHESIDVKSQRFWRSEYGQQIHQVIQQATQAIDEAVSCEPAYGKILRVTNNQVQIDIGSNQGVRAGDQLTLLQMNQFYDPSGKSHQQYQLHPSKLLVDKVFPDSALLIPEDGSLLANIQPNDFVARR